MAETRQKWKEEMEAKKKVAKQVDIVDFCEQQGFDLTTKNGKDYYSAEHSSLWVNRETNSYSWFTNGKAGDVISFAQTFFDKSFYEAINMLQGEEYTKREPSTFVQKPKEPFRYFYKHDANTQAVEAYLCQERGVSPTIVQALIEKGLIRQSTYKGDKDCLFVWGKTGKRVGVTIQGTQRNEDEYGKRGTKKLVGRNSEANYGFNVSLGIPKSLYFFESPVDLLSYWTLQEASLKDCRLIAMTGVHEKTVWNMIDHTYKSRGVMPTSIYFPVDNDRAGQRFVDRFRDMAFETSEGHDMTFLPLIPDDFVIPTANVAVYQAVSEAAQVDWKMIAAFHKAEANFSETMEVTNHMDISLFFSEKQKNGKEKPVLDIQTAAQTCADKLQAIRETKGYRFDKLFEDFSTNEIAFINKVKHFYAAYTKGDLTIKDTLYKDWNDTLSKHTDIEKVAEIMVYRNQKEQLLTVEEVEVSSKEQAIKFGATIRDKQKVLGHFEADSKEEMEKLIKIYGFEAVDKEDIRKYEPELLKHGHAKEELLAR
ncbi:toprim domain-containing protein [Listeria newyorkensis]|uniref:toprim domain-containing protein n=1 Tax=Listeria newyorkensis TaxID=1497681 RepID=UPI00051D7351|nr:toprim domain-containing protein [Listeria newyorkensis]KGL43608.1 hypothetical protein EP58_07670 [Listeria newyorkensis]